MQKLLLLWCGALLVEGADPAPQLRWRGGRRIQDGDDDVDTAPAALGLFPDLGPVDGGTKVVVRTEGLNVSKPFNAEIQTVKKGLQGHSPIQAPVMLDGETLYFVMPDLTFKHWGAGTAVLVSLREAEAKKAQPVGPLLFRLYQRLESLRPQEIRPCCNFKTSGGEVISLTLKHGHGEAIPAQHATLRFRGLATVRDMAGQYLNRKEHAEWVAAAIGSANEDDPDSESWHIYGVTPAWPFAEDDIHVEISWNRQQFVPCQNSINFKDPTSFFGVMATQLDEKHAGANADSEDEEDDSDVLTAVLSKGSGHEKDGEKEEMTEVTLRDKRGDAFILSRPSDTTHLEEDWRIIQDLFFLTIACAAGGSAAEKFLIPNIIGYLIGGMIVGPGGFDVIMELVQIESIAQIGVCLLLFCIGLELTCDELVTNSRSALAGLLGMMLLCCGTVFLAVFLTETEVQEAVFIGLFASLASTPVSLQAVERNCGAPSAAEKAEKSVLLAVLIAQDIMLAALLAGMPLVFRPSSDVRKTPGQESTHHHGPTPPPVAGEPITVLAAAACAFSITVLFASWYLRRLGCTGAMARDWLLSINAGLLLLIMMSYCFVMAHFTNDLNLSLELGAFMAGLMMKMKSPAVADRAEHLIGVVKDCFVAWFFASIGLVIPPLFLLDNLRIILSVGTIFFLLKLITGFAPLVLLVRGSKSPVMQSLRTSWILAHISEFGFVLASKGEKWGLISRHVYLLLLGTNAMSLCLAPFLFRAREFLLPAEDAEDGGSMHSPRWVASVHKAAAEVAASPLPPVPHVALRRMLVPSCLGNKFREKERHSPHDSDGEETDLDDGPSPQEDHPLRSRTED